MSLSGLCFAAIAGVLPLVWYPHLPGSTLVISALVCGVGLLLFPWRIARYGGITLLVACWAVMAAYRVLVPASTLTTGIVHGEVRIQQVSPQGRARVVLERINGQWLALKPQIQLSPWPGDSEPCAGQRWQMHLRLRPIHTALNVPGFDSQRYGVARHQILTGKAVRARVLDASCSWRSRFIAHIDRQAASLGFWPVMAALAFGDRQSLSQQNRDLLRNTGTAHLMAISGLHIAQSAGVFWLLARALQRLLPAWRIGVRGPLFAGLIGAALYTWLTGAQPPAIRTLLALTLWIGLRLSGRLWRPEQVWLCCVAGVLFMDPLTILSDSFRLSAGAVGGLILWYRLVPMGPFTLRPTGYSAEAETGGGRTGTTGLLLWRLVQKGFAYMVGLVHLQVGIGILLLPLQVALFHGISWTAWLANLVAVPAVAIGVVPLLLAGMLGAMIPGVTLFFWRLADSVLGGVFRYLAWLPDGWLEVDRRFLLLSLLPLTLLVLWRLRLHRASPSLVVVVLAVCGFSFWPRQNDDQSWSVHMLDVGNGLAMVVEKNRRALLYDTGNRWRGGDSGLQTIIPWLRWNHLRPEGVIISHGHLDHIGGLDSIIAAWPHIPVYSAMLTPGHLSCFQGQSWQWQGLFLQVLWPPRNQPGTENNHSCVVRISDGRHSILLTGDIERSAELAMLKTQRQYLLADVIQVPHHGSRTSSTASLLQAVGPDDALASVGRYNQWRFPAVQVVRRYREQNIRWHDTAQSGQLSVHFVANEMQILSARKQILPRWYHQWFGVPADSR